MRNAAAWGAFLVTILIATSVRSQASDPNSAAPPSSTLAPQETPAAEPTPSAAVSATAPPARIESAAPSRESGAQASVPFRHQGFYLRGTDGVLTYAWVFGNGPYGPASISNIGGTNGSLAIGGTLAPGFVLAGHLGTNTVGGHFTGGPFTNATVTSAMRPGVTTTASGGAGVSLFELGFLIDWFPDPSRGLHFGASAGIGGLSIDNSADGSGYGAAGFGASLFGGYDFWVGHAWSLGLDLAVRGVAPELSLTDSGGSPSGYRMTPITIASEWSVLYY
jgi:hypothetical protein